MDTKFKRNLLHIVCFAALCCLFYGCPAEKQETVYIDQESKNYCLFKEGSYWIYQDSVSQKNDSVVLYEVREGKVGGNHR
ncbi:MAG: hypothetical protein LBV69_02160 [Bacteroidales bacterium]|jgi:hypothetical protein|nr:hypothetical protein [Bacteroidales bacterium]